MTDDLSRRVLDFVASELAIRVEKLSLSSRMVHDLGCEGDDADELMQAFALKFEVDLAQFVFLDYFQYEGFLIPPMIEIRRMMEGKKKRPITVADLIRAAERKRWEA